MLWLWTLGIIIVLFLVYLVSVYNSFVVLKNGIESNFKQIKVALKKRLDLITQVVSAVKGEMKFEKSTLTEITKLRSGNIDELSPEKVRDLDRKSSSILSSLKVQVENYPNLKANENVKQLIKSINDLEEEISRLRYTYNNTIQEYNTKRDLFPTNIFASILGFKRQNYLSFEENVDERPKIDL